MVNLCLCGCKHYTKIDKCGRTYKYILGRNRRNKKLSEKTKKLISINKKGFKHSEESKAKISLNHRNIKGKNNPCYGLYGVKHPKYKKPGERTQTINRMIRGLSNMDIWNNKILKRDNYTCKNCNIRNTQFNTHHIISLSDIIQYYNITTTETALDCKLLWNINNGITYCLKCHDLLKNKRGLL